MSESDFASDSDVEAALDRASRAFMNWKRSSAYDRSQLLDAARTRLAARAEEFAQLICREVKKPITLARAEVERALDVLKWSSAEALRFGGNWSRLDVTAARREGWGIEQRFPRGAVLGITPFNFPLNLLLHKVAPALACGCAIIIKPSPHARLTAQATMTLFEGLEPDVLQCLNARDDQTKHMTLDPRIKSISFTGSVGVGKVIREQAPHQPVTLELGGNAACILTDSLEKSDFESIAQKITRAAYGYAGQSCISVQNIWIADQHFDSVWEHLKKATAGFPYGDPANAAVLCGPLIGEASYNNHRSKILELENAGVRLERSTHSVTRGEINHLLAPTLIDATSNHPLLRSIIDEELFAPIATVRRYRDIKEVFASINSGRYGLQTGIFTRNTEESFRAFQELEVGGVVINDVPTLRYDHQPYGGTKDSGAGREGILYAMQEMTELKFLAFHPSP